MKKISSAIFLTLIFLTFDDSRALTYYVSNKGNNNSDGLSPNTPWGSIGKVNSQMQQFRPGDQILFERGGYFEGQINLNVSGSDGSPVIFGAYGEGPDPVISGSVPVKGWTMYDKNIWQVETNVTVKNLFVNGTRMTLARFPNSGFLTITEPFKKANTGFASNHLKQKAGYWNKSSVRFRSVNWAYEFSTIKDYQQGKIYFDQPTYYDSQSGYGFYLDNNFGELDTVNEWYYKPISKSKGILYLIPENKLNLTDAFIEASVYDAAFASYQLISNIVIRDIEMKNQISSGVTLKSASNVRVENCTFYRMNETGVSVLNGSNSSIVNCRFYSVAGKAVYLMKSLKCDISNNIFRNTGLIPGYGTNKDAFNMSAIIVLSGEGNTVSGNNILNTGHDGINCLGEKNIIEKNVIKNTLLYLNDGGAIKTYGNTSKNSVIRNNYVFSVFGNLDATLKNNNGIIANGIYLDAFTNNMDVSDNTILNTKSGIFLYDGCQNNKFERNVCYDNITGIIFYQEKTPMTGNLVTSNYFVGVTGDQAWVQLIASFSGFVPAKFAGNYYISEYGDGLFQFRSGASVKAYSFSQWKKLIGNNEDASPKMILDQNASFVRLLTNMTDERKELLLSGKLRDADHNIISGSISLDPWSSKILFASTEDSNLENLNIAGGPLEFSQSNQSVSQWFNVFGENLKKTITIKAPSGILVSLNSDSDFKNNLELNTNQGQTDQIIFVRTVESGNEIKEILVTSGSLTQKIGIIYK